MKIDSIRITAEVTREKGSSDELMLSEWHESGEKLYGIVEQFSWMPFIITSRDCSLNGDITFHLLMVSK